MSKLKLYDKIKTPRREVRARQITTAAVEWAIENMEGLKTWSDIIPERREHLRQKLTRKVLEIIP